MLSSLRLTKVADNLYEMATLAVRTTKETHGSLGNALTKTAEPQCVQETTYQQSWAIHTTIYQTEMQ